MYAELMGNHEKHRIKSLCGNNLDLVEGRVLHDAFVLAAKAGAVYVAANASYVCNYPTITDDTTNDIFNLASNTANAKMYYTTDGTDPRYSPTAAVYTGNVNYHTFPNNSTLKCYAADLDNGIFASSLVSKTLTI